MSAGRAFSAGSERRHAGRASLQSATMKSSRSGRAMGAKGFGRRALERRVLREDIRDHLIQDILNGRLAPGDRIVETRIARQFGVSHAPGREALRHLVLFV